MFEDNDVYLVFDKTCTVPFYIREGIGHGVTFHDLDGVVTEPGARKELERRGFDPEMKLVVL